MVEGEIPYTASANIDRPGAIVGITFKKQVDRSGYFRDALATLNTATGGTAETYLGRTIRWWLSRERVDLDYVAELAQG